MAKNYNDIYTAVYTKGNKMDFGNSMIRGNGIPLDITDVYNSLTAAQTYVSTNPLAYEGQVLAVTENNDTVVYVIAARLAADGETVEHYLKEVGSAPAVDGTTIKLVDGKLTAVIPEFEDTDTQYTLSVTADGKISFISDADGAVATTVSFVGAQGISVSSNAETGIITFTGPDLSGLATKEEVNAKANSVDVYTKTEADNKVSEAVAGKANSADVYTKTETDTKIGEAIAAADHLKRTIVDTKDDINVNAANADQFVYMVPSGLESDDNKYYEYIVVIERDEEGTEVNRYLEQVGNWEVDLSDYVKTTDAEKTYAKITDLTPYAKSDDVANTYVSNDSLASTLGSYSTSEKIAEDYVSKTGLSTTLESYSTSEKIAEDYVSKTGLSTTLADYAKSSDIPTDYVSDSEFSDEIAKYETAETAAGKYAPKAEIEQALGNRFTKEETNSLLAGKVDVVEGYSLVADTEIERLATVNENAEENYINDVSDKFTVVEEKLDLVAVPQNIVGGLNKTSWTVDENDNFVASSAPATLAEILQPASYDAQTKTGTSGLMTAEQAQKLSALVIGEEGGVEISGTVNADNVTGLGAWISTNRDKVEGLFSVEAETLLDSLNTTINTETTGLVSKVGVLETKVGNLETLTSTHSDEIKALQDAMTWVDMDEPEVAE